MKFNNLTKREMYDIFLSDLNRLHYKQIRMINGVTGNDALLAEKWHNPEGYEYYIVSVKSGNGYAGYFYGVAGTEGRERFVAFSEAPDAYKYGVPCFTYHFLRRYYERGMKRNLGFTPYKAIAHFSTKNVASFALLHNEHDGIDALENGIAFSHEDEETGMVIQKTFVALDQLKEDQHEAYDIIRKLFIIQNAAIRGKYGPIGSEGYMMASRGIDHVIREHRPVMEEILTRYSMDD